MHHLCFSYISLCIYDIFQSTHNSYFLSIILAFGLYLILIVVSFDRQLLGFVLVFQDRVCLCSLGFPETCPIDQAGIKFRSNCPTCWMLVLKTCTTKPYIMVFKIKSIYLFTLHPGCSLPSPPSPPQLLFLWRFYQVRASSNVFSL